MKLVRHLFVISIFSVLLGCGSHPNQTPASTSTPIPNVAQTDNEISDASVQQQVPEVEEESAQNKDILSLIPDGWVLMDSFDEDLVKAEGDLNKDGIDDVAIVIEEVIESNAAPNRALLIAFKNNEGNLALSIIAENVILKENEGGVWGDPFESISIDRGSIIVSDYGGSNWRWYNRYRFRYQDQDWYMIGATRGSYFSGDASIDQADEEDFNLLTGDYIVKKRNEEGEMEVTKGNRGKMPLVKLSQFNIENM
ncbi:hypothetical protein M6D81_01275 [Paenibacillus sp. J5C_2022]|uniref:hypothetical protein n=1 Tax=Paenibacillus sp. J5C2022 TaxID=2977129 RepID=UPI0021D05D55|nr:hypothetical protein [Paenibacillus sp. J5C2022]MCU6707326.1 hypothetical protein [Paenibacillus sp. J5C2022]